MRECGECRFCCWSYKVGEVPKDALAHCPHECAMGCQLFNSDKRPTVCDQFGCPYIHGEPMHRPDKFYDVLKNMEISIGSFVPWVPESIPVEEAIDLVRKTNTVMAGVQFEGIWLRSVIPLHKRPGPWRFYAEMLEPWRRLVAFYAP